MLRETVAKNVREIRKSKKISQAMLANKIGQSPVSVSNLESKHTDIPISTLEKYANALDTPPEDLVKGER